MDKFMSWVLRLVGIDVAAPMRKAAVVSTRQSGSISEYIKSSEWKNRRQLVSKSEYQVMREWIGESKYH